MFLIILLIYFILLILLEFIFIIVSKDKNKSKELYNIIDNLDNKEKNIIENHHKKYGMLLEESDNDIDIKNYIGNFYCENYYGFFINLDMWNLLECNKLYKFNAPVTIKIIKICKDKKIRYYTSK